MALNLATLFFWKIRHGWAGLLIEPAKIWQSALVSNRPNAQISFSAVVPNYEDRFLFNQLDNPGHSHLVTNSQKDWSRTEGQDFYNVPCCTLTDLLTQHNMPYYVDFLSLDIESLEFDILNQFDFSRHRFGVICVEHNYRSDRLDIYNLLSHQGYKRVFRRFSKVDDWYIDIRGE